MIASSKIHLQGYGIHTTIYLEVTAILSKLFKSHAILDNTINFW